MARLFHLTPRLAALVRMPRSFDRKFWRLAAAKAGHPDLRPHDLRHTALTLAGKRPEASLDSLQKLGGWQSAAMADAYLHPDSRAIEPLASSERRRVRCSS
ncbi:MAG: tyrosine-type recombinase/integrase [Methanomicrobiales archaeon]|nr:tyrosine-type recombinase/integrase [Methanomicrobiales archaeon]